MRRSARTRQTAPTTAVEMIDAPLTGRVHRRAHGHARALRLCLHLHVDVLVRVSTNVFEGVLIHGCICMCMRVATLVGFGCSSMLPSVRMLGMGVDCFERIWRSNCPCLCVPQGILDIQDIAVPKPKTRDAAGVRTTRPALDMPSTVRGQFRFATHSRGTAPGAPLLHAKGARLCRNGMSGSSSPTNEDVVWTAQCSGADLGNENNACLGPFLSAIRALCAPGSSASGALRPRR